MSDARFRRVGLMVLMDGVLGRLADSSSRRYSFLEPHGASPEAEIDL